MHTVFTNMIINMVTRILTYFVAVVLLLGCNSETGIDITIQLCIYIKYSDYVEWGGEGSRGGRRGSR